MPIERRSTRTQTTTVVISVVALCLAVIVGVLLIRAASDSGNSVSIRLGDDVFEAGGTVTKAESIAEDGPLLFSDVAGRGQRRPIFLQHLGDDPRTGWSAFEAVAPGAPEGCFLEWDADAELFRGVDGCVEETFLKDGTGLPQFTVTVTETGELEIDLRESSLDD